MNSKILVVGSSNTDMIIKTASLPKPGETVIGGTFYMASGGKGANQAIAAKKSGGDVVFVTRVGEDDFGKRSIENYKKDGLDITHIIHDEESASGIALIMVDDSGENSIAVASGANNNISPDDIKRISDVVDESQIILVQLEIPLESVKAAVKQAYEKKKTVILNPAPAQMLGDDLLKMITIITPNENEAGILSGIKVEDEESAIKAARNLLSRGVQKVILTMGSRGLLYCDDSDCEMMPAYKVDAVDTTAAGDVFNGALASGLAEKMELRSAIRFASAAAGISVTRMGAQTSIPDRNEIEMFMRSGSLVA